MKNIKTYKMENMKLFKQGGMWVIKTDDIEVIELFGGDTLPTPFSEGANGEQVLKTIKALNPDANVSFKEAIK